MTRIGRRRPCPLPVAVAAGALVLAGAEACATRASAQEGAAQALLVEGLGALNAGRPLDALEKLGRAAAIERAWATGPTPLLQTILTSTGATLIALDRPAEALSAFEEALAVARKAAAGESPDVAARLNDVATALERLGRADQAVARVEEAASVLERFFKGDHPMLAFTLSNLALKLVAAGRSEDALSQAERSLAMSQRLFGGDHPEVANGFSALGSVMTALGRVADAVPATEAALNIRRRYFPGDNAPVAQSLNDLGIVLMNAGRHKEAQARLEEALAMRRRLFPGDHLAVSESLYTLGRALANSGQPAAALERSTQAYKMLALAAGDHPSKAQVLTSIADQLRATGKLDAALQRQEEAIAMQRRLYGGDHPLIGESLNLLAEILLELGRTPEALRTCEEALAMFRRLHRGDHPHVARTIGSMGTLLQALGRIEEAHLRHEEALRMTRALTGGKDHPDVAAALNNLGATLMGRGRAGEALPLHEEAHDLLSRLYDGDHPGRAATLANMGGALSALGRADEALHVRRRALEMIQRLFPHDHQDVLRALLSMGDALSAVGDREHALSHYETAVAMRRRLLPGDHPETAGALLSMASALHANGRVAEARSASEEALAIVERLQMADHPLRVWSLYALGRALVDLGRLQEARERYEQAVPLARRLRLGGVAEIATALAVVHLLQGRPADAAVALEEAIGSMETARVEVGGSEMDRAAFFHALSTRLGAFDLMVHVQLGDNRPDKALEYVERARARGMLDLIERGQRIQGRDLLAPAEDVARASDNQPMLAQVASLRARLRAAEATVATRTADLSVTRARADVDAPAKKAAIDAMLTSLDQARDQYLGARRDALNLLRQHVSFDLKPRTAVQLQALPRGRERLLVYSIEAVRSVLFLVGPDRISALDIAWPDGTPVREKELQDAIVEYVDGIVAEGRWARGGEPLEGGPPPVDPAAQRQRGQRLFRALVPAHVWKEIASAPRVFIIPDALLQRLPFEALMTGGDGSETYWLDDGPAIVYGTSATILLGRREARAQQRERRARTGPLAREAVVLADPIYDRAPAANADARVAAERRGYRSLYGPLHPLPATREEADEIHKAITGQAYDGAKPSSSVRLLIGDEATRRRLWELAPGSRFVHLATHGLIEQGSKASYSSLALTLPPTPTSDDYGFLTLVDLFDHWWGRLRDAELVVLSACETQRGPVLGGEATYGLPWGFMYAGAPAIVASLWLVDDASTARLMGRFYRVMNRRAPPLSGQEARDRLDAFVDARRWLKKDRPQPYFWAPFIYLGEPD